MNILSRPLRLNSRARAPYLLLSKKLLCPLAKAILLALLCGKNIQAAEGDVQFNTDVLDVKDRSRIELGRFSRAGYLLPGDYQLAIMVNKSEVPEQTITFLAPENDPQGSEACLTKEMVSKLGLKESAMRSLKWWNNDTCLDASSLEGMTMRPDLGASVLYLNIPQSYLEYSSENWDPPSRWDNGVPGVLLDYNLNGMNSWQSQGSQAQSLSGNGTAGANMGPWRFRADWQAQYNHDQRTQQHWDWSRYYAYRAITSLQAKLMVGENYLSSSMFDNFRYTGASLVTDDSQLPPNLRGYAPEVSGVAKTNAKVTVSQMGRQIYETTVAAGPFRIQDLNDAVSGKLDVKVQEQDGSVQTFQVDTASIPYLTRPGSLRYKVSAGKPAGYEHQSQGPEFATGEFSWGVNNGWSFYGGGLFSAEYNSLAVGIGRDLLMFGALSLDTIQSRASDLPGMGTKQGGSYRLSYSKRFDEYDSQITFAGYRFSERDFMSMSQYMNVRYHNERIRSSGKELYTTSINKQFRDLNLSAYLNYSHQTYWDREASDSWNASLSNYFDIGRFKNVSLSMSVNRARVNNKNDDGIYFGLSMPLSGGASIGYNAQSDGSGMSNSVRYGDQLSNGDNYSLSAGKSSGGSGTANAYYTHVGDIAEFSANSSYSGSDYSAVGVSLRSGVTATAHGVAMHRTNGAGGTRMMVDTDGVSGVPVRGYGNNSKTNIFGKTVVADISSYYRTSINIDLDSLPDDVEATRSVVQDTLTEGAIGYRKFGVLSGQKAMAVIKLADGSTPPFGATVANENKVQTGITGDDGSVWLSGIKPGSVMKVDWDGKAQCQIHLPEKLLTNKDQNLLLPCT